MIGYRCHFIDLRGEPLPDALPIVALGIDRAIDYGLEALVTKPQHVGFEIYDPERIVHRYIRPPRDI